MAVPKKSQKQGEEMKSFILGKEKSDTWSQKNSLISLSMLQLPSGSISKTEMAQ